MEYYNKNLKDIYKEFETTENGLKSSEISKLREKYGKNELPAKKKDSIIGIFFSQFKNPIEIILVITVILSFLVGETIDAIALIFIIAVDVLMGTYEEWKALKDASSLINMIKVNARVIRDGKEQVIDSSELVPGDVIALESGDRISADCRIIECYNFQVNESSLTGESVLIVKTNETLDDDVVLSERKNMVFAGTSVATGRAKAVVLLTGTNTEIGKIAKSVTETEEEKSPLTIRIEKFSKQITAIIIVIAIITYFVLVRAGYDNKSIFLSVIALAVSAMPEGLPLALTMALTIASKKMLKKNVIIKKLNSVEALGSCTVIASDKTGTLTVNEQTAKKIVLTDGSEFEITGSGYNGNGEIKPLNGAKLEAAERIITMGAINNEAHLEKVKNKWESYGDSIDIAFLALAEKYKLKDKPKVVDIIPYESENQYSAVFYSKGKELHCTVKGSLEKVMEFSSKKEEYIKQNERLTSEGYRVIALADGKVDSDDITKVKKLEFLGMIAFIDPVREHVKESIQECATAGIKVIMITGDHPLTAYAIAKELELCTNKEEVATGRDVEKYRKKGEKEFDKFVSSIKVFSRVTPMDKLDIVNSLKRQGEFVAVTGDGVNDAPAIKAANVGIAMGSGTDVAKDTASMIVSDDSFVCIVDSVREGRTAHSNIRKITLFLLGCGFAEVAFFLLSIFFGYDIPLVAIQLLWLNVITDGLQDIALSFETPEDDIMKQKPRDTKESLFSKDLMIEVLILGLTITAIVFGVWKMMMDKGYGLTYARSITMMLMVFIQNINVLNCRSEYQSIFKNRVSNNPLCAFVIVGSIFLQLLMGEIPLTAKFLKVDPLGWDVVFKIFLTACLILVVFEIYKLIFKQKKKD